MYELFCTKLFLTITKAMSKINNNNNKRDLNNFLILFLIFAILQHLGKIAKNFFLLSQPQNSYFIIDKNIVLYSIIISISVIIVIIGTMCKKKWGVIGFFCIQIANLIGIQALSAEQQNFGLNYVVTCILCILFGLLLLLRSNGKSAWKVIFENTESKPRKNYLFLLRNLHWFKKKAIANHDKECNVKEFVTIKESSVKNSKTIKDKKRTISNVKRRHFSKVLKIVLIAIVTVSICTYSYFLYRHYTSNEYLMNKANVTFKKGEIKKALEMYEEIADKKEYVPAKARLGYLYIINDSVPLDATKGVKYLQEASITDSASMRNLLCIYSGHVYKRKDYKNLEKAKYYAEIAIRGNRLLGEAYLILGNYFAEKEDYASAYFNWEKSSNYKFAPAFRNLGIMFYNGMGCRANLNKAYRYFNKALKLDHKDKVVLYFMGLFHLNGEVVKQDKLKARDFFKQAADLGDEDAMEEYSKLQLEYPLSDFSIDDF